MLLIKSSDMALPNRVAKSSFWQSAMVEVLNPKAALFFLAFLPQFVVPEATWPVPLQLFVLGTLVNIAFSVADLIYIMAADGVQKRLIKSPAATIWAQRLAGTLLIGLGLKLATTRAL